MRIFSSSPCNTPRSERGLAYKYFLPYRPGYNFYPEKDNSLIITSEAFVKRTCFFSGFVITEARWMPAPNFLIFLTSEQNKLVTRGENAFQAGHFSSADSVSCAGAALIHIACTLPHMTHFPLPVNP